MSLLVSPGRQEGHIHRGLEVIEVAGGGASAVKVSPFNWLRLLGCEPHRSFPGTVATDLDALSP